MGRQKLYKREKLLEMAMYVFWEKGYTKTSMADISSASGVDKKSLFREFSNKEKLFEEVLQLYALWDKKSFEMTLDKEPLGKKNIQDFLQSMKTVHKIKGCLLNKSIVQSDQISTAHFNIIEETMVYLESLLEKNLLAMEKNGQLRNAKSPAELAKYLLYMAQGVWTMGNYENKPEHIDMVIGSVLVSL